MWTDAGLEPGQRPHPRPQPNICPGPWAIPIGHVNTAMPGVDRGAIGQRRWRSARPPQAGEAKIAMHEVAEASTPAHMFTAAGETTPNSGRNSGTIGETM
jgi:hypothetical protein